MYPDYNTLLRFYKNFTGANVPNTYPNAPNMEQSNILPPQTVIQVNGKTSVDALKMSPNSSVLLMDTTQPIVWLCTSDGLGNVTSAPYDIAPHKDEPPVDVDSLETRVTNIETLISNLLGGREDDKSNDTTTKSREDELTNGKSKQHKE